MIADELSTLAPDVSLVIFERPTPVVSSPKDAFAATTRFVGPEGAPRRYELLDEGRAGGEGTTFRARRWGEGGTPIPVAVKRLRRPRGAGEDWPIADWSRWEDQLAVLRELRSAHIVRVHEYFLGPAPTIGEATQRSGNIAVRTVPYVVMEWISGPSLTEWVRSGDRTLEQRVRLVAHLAAAVGTLHSTSRTAGNPMLHRDIKPDNCLVTEQRGLVLVDLGAVRPLDSTRDRLGLHTPRYTSPEVRRDPGAPREVSSDLYSLGAVAYFVLTGSDPPSTSAPGKPEPLAANIYQALRDTPLRPAQRSSVAQTVLELMGSTPAERNAVDPVAWAERLVDAARPRSTRRRTVTLASVALAVTLATAGLAWRAEFRTSGALQPSASPSGTPSAAVARVVPSSSWQAFGAGAIASGFAVTRPSPTTLRLTSAKDYLNLHGVFLSGAACASRVSMTVQVDGSAGLDDYGIAVAPRAVIDPDTNQPVGASVQYEWEGRGFAEGTDTGTPPGSYVRPAQLPGGAWRVAVEPTAAPDIRVAHRLTFDATGTRISITFDDTLVAAYTTQEVECGGIAIRTWGRTFSVSDIRLTQT